MAEGHESVKRDLGRKDLACFRLQFHSLITEYFFSPIWTSMLLMVFQGPNPRSKIQWQGSINKRIISRNLINTASWKRSLVFFGFP